MEETENKTKISREIAEQDFNNWCEELEIDYDTNEMNADEKKDFEVLKDRIVKAIMTGRCVIDGDVMHYTLSKKMKVVLPEWFLILIRQLLRLLLAVMVLKTLSAFIKCVRV